MHINSKEIVSFVFKEMEGGGGEGGWRPSGKKSDYIQMKTSGAWCISAAESAMKASGCHTCPQVLLFWSVNIKEERRCM